MKDMPYCKKQVSLQQLPLEFHIESELVRHLRTHKKERSFVCSWHGCDWSFKQQSNLMLHYRDYTGEKPCRCTWKDCNECFAWPKQLGKHMESHIGKMELTADERHYSDTESELSGTSSSVEDIEMGGTGRKVQGS